MKPCLLFFFLAAATTIAVCASSDNSNDWDYLLMISRWPATVCDTSSDRTCTVYKNITDFTLHGLWANRNDSSGPAFCDKSDPFDPDTIADLIGDLKEYWTDFYTPDSMFLYSHEWEKHGTCSKTDYVIGDERKFFTETLQLKKDHNIVQVLNDAGVYPGTDTFAVSDLVEPIKKKFGVTPLLYCQTHNEKISLLHIRFCVDKDMQLFECNDSEKQHVETEGPCHNAFHWEPIKY